MKFDFSIYESQLNELERRGFNCKFLCARLLRKNDGNVEEVARILLKMEERKRSKNEAIFMKYPGSYEALKAKGFTTQSNPRLGKLLEMFEGDVEKLAQFLVAPKGERSHLLPPKLEKKWAKKCCKKQHKWDRFESRESSSVSIFSPHSSSGHSFQHHPHSHHHHHYCDRSQKVQEQEQPLVTLKADPYSFTNPFSGTSEPSPFTPVNGEEDRASYPVQKDAPTSLSTPHVCPRNEISVDVPSSTFPSNSDLYLMSSSEVEFKKAEIRKKIQDLNDQLKELDLSNEAKKKKIERLNFVESKLSFKITKIDSSIAHLNAKKEKCAEKLIRIRAEKNALMN